MVDVRSTDQFRSGHLIAALNIVFADLERSINKLNKYKSKPIILVDNIGQEAVKAGVLLRKQGFEMVYFLAGGITAWQKADLPLVKD